MRRKSPIKKAGVKRKRGWSDTPNRVLLLLRTHQWPATRRRHFLAESMEKLASEKAATKTRAFLRPLFSQI